MLAEILEAVIALSLPYASPYTAITIGSLPSNNSLAMQIGSGNPESEYFNRGKYIAIPFVLNGKNTNQKILVDALTSIHIGLTQKKVYANGVGWTIKNIETISFPNFIEQEDSTKQWLFGSILQINFELEGV